MPDLLTGDLVIDTDVASAMRKGNLADWASRQIVGRRVWLPFVTVGELWKWAEVRSWGERRRRDLESWMAIRRVIHADGEVAHTSGQLAAAASRRGRPRPQNDTWIAACCIRHDLPLLTVDRRDFEDFATHDGLRLLGDPSGG